MGGKINVKIEVTTLTVIKGVERKGVFRALHLAAVTRGDVVSSLLLDAMWDFALLAVCTKSFEGMDYRLPGASATDEELLAAWDTYLKTFEDTFVANWKAAITGQERFRLNEPDLLPPDQVPDAKKKK